MLCQCTEHSQWRKQKNPTWGCTARTLPWNESQAPDVSNIQPKWERLWRYVQHFWTTSKLQTLAPYWNKTSRPRGKKPCMLLNACKRETNITLWVVEGFWHLTLFVLRRLKPNQSKVCRVCWTSCKHHDPPSLHPSSESNQIKSLLKSCCVLPRQTKFTEPQNHLHTKSVTSFRWMKTSLVKNSTHQGIANSSFRIPKDYYSQVYSIPEGRCSQWVGSISTWHLSFVVLQPPSGILEHWPEFRRLQSRDLARCIKMKKWARLIQKLIKNRASKSVALCPVGDKEVLHSYR